MDNMFGVRSSPRALSSICSRALPCALRAPRSSADSAASGKLHLIPHHMPSIRLGRTHPCPTPTSCTSAARALRSPYTRPSSCAVGPRPASCALVSTRQDAKVFNQPLSFDISSVTNIGYMFSVRSARTLAPSLQSSPPALPVHAACAAVISRPPHLPGPHRMPLDRLQTPCPAPTSGSSVARGRATCASSVGMGSDKDARAGVLWEAAQVAEMS